ncbi:MAG: indole-3-glycerol phosphate synthase TrpC [Thermodesulfovibrionales bacterium]|nr:indole-3-glycerol phosphate synthase TrpC [Thermodesulfovibrionales bacterium]
MDLLKEIVNKKKERLKDSKILLPFKELKRKLSDLQVNTANFASSVKKDGQNVKLIAEIKKASPLKGVLAQDLDLESITRLYSHKDVDAISVLTEEDFFKGNIGFINKIKEISAKPVLRKDFIFDEYQLYESRFYGADAILLISSILDKEQAKEYLHIAYELGLAVLFEIHTEKDLEKALDIKAEIVGINNRNLKTMDVDLSNTLRLRQFIPKDKIVISASGIKSKEDVVTLMGVNIDAILVGTAIMKAIDKRKKIAELKCLD